MKRCDKLAGPDTSFWALDWWWKYAQQLNGLEAFDVAVTF